MKSTRLKTALAATGICLGAVLCARAYFAFAESQALSGETWLKRRIVEGIDALPAIVATPEPVGLMIGASEMESGIDPIAFDDRLQALGIPMKTFNFSVRNLTLIQPDWTARIVEEFQRSGRKAEFVIMKFSPIRATLKTKNSWRRELSLDILSLIHSPRKLLSMMPQDADAAARMLAYRYVFGGHSSGTGVFNTRRMLRDAFSSEAEGYDRTANASVMRLLDLLWQNPLLHPYPAWDPATRGGFFWGLPDSDPVLTEVESEFARPGNIEEMVQWNIRNFDAGELPLDPHVVRDFTESLISLHAIAKRVILLDFPEDERFFRSRPVERRTLRTIETMARRAQVDLISYDHGLLKKEDYIDPAHLSRLGREKLTHRLADDVASLLQPNPPK